MRMERLLYRPTEAAALLGVSRAKVYQLLAQGQLGSVKIAASRRIPAAELTAFVERLSPENQSGDQANSASNTNVKG